MSGTKQGGAKARAHNLAKDPDFYKKIGAMGGAKGKTGGFASTEVGPDGLTGKERARKVGAAGGRKSRRSPSKGLKDFKLSYESMETEPNVHKTPTLERQGE